MRYRATDIARILGLSDERVRQVLRDLQLTHPTLRTIDDLPRDLRERVRIFIDDESERSKPQPLKFPNESQAPQAAPA